MSSTEWTKELKTFLGSKQLYFAPELPQNQVAVIPTGSYGLNRILGIHGWPKGRIVELFGAESSGKSTLALQAIAECQKVAGNAVYLDLEGSLDLEWAAKNGVNLQSLLVSKPDSGEQAFTIINALIKTQMVDLIIVDSVAAMIPKAEVQSEIEDQSVGLHARLMGKGLRMIQASLLQNERTCIIFINQIRAKIGNIYGSNVTTTGGYSLRFAASIRIELKRYEAIRDNNEIHGYYIKATVLKNKLAPPMKSALLPFSFQCGFDQLTEIIEQAVKLTIITKKGSWYYYQNANLAQGLKATRKKLEEDSELLTQIKTAIMAENHS